MDLQHVSEPYRVAFDASPSGMAFVAPDWTFVKANESVCRMLGRTEAELASHSANEFIHPDDQERALRELAHLLAGDVNEYEIEARFVHADGHIGWARVRVGTLRDDDGEIALVLALSEDVSEQHRMREIHERLLGLVLVGQGEQALAQSLADLISSPVALLDAYGQVIAHGEHHGRLEPPARAELEAVERGIDIDGLTVTALRVGEHIEGYLVAAEAPNASHLNSMAIEQAASSFTLQLAMTRNAEEVEHRLRGDLFEAMLSDRPPDTASLVRWAQRLGHDLHAFRRVAVIRMVEHDEADSARTLARLAHTSAEVAQQTAPGSMAVPRVDGVLLVLSADTADQARLIGQRVVERARLLSGIEIVIGQSRSLASPAAFADAFREARQAAEAALTLPRLGSVAGYEDLDLQQLLLGQRPRDEVAAAARHTLAPLLDDDQTGGRLTSTLVAYFQSLCVLEATAQRLGIHVNTLRYRIRQIEDALTIDLQDPRTRINLQLALEALQL